MLIRVLEIAQYVAVTDDNKLVIGGIFDTLNATRDPNAPADAAPLLVVHGASLVAIVEGSVADGLQHTMGLRVVNDDNEEVWSQHDIAPLVFQLNAWGRPMRAQARVDLTGLALPGNGDYSIELLVDGKRLGDVHLYVQGL